MDHRGNVVITHTGWVGRLRSSLAGAVLGAVLFIISLALLAWNEARNVAEVRALSECLGVVVEGGCTPASGNDGRLVHASCALQLPYLSDDAFRLTVLSARLQRSVERYQWSESSSRSCRKDNVGGGETCVTTYSYSTAWGASAVDSSAFHNSMGHTNPGGAWPFSSALFTPPVLPFGTGYTLPAALQASLGASTPVPVPDPSALCAEQQTPCPWTSSGGALYWSYNGGGAPASSPNIGDLRISWKDSSDTTASVIATQAPSGDVNGSRTFSRYVAKSGHACFLLETGLVSAPDMIQRAKERNAAATWILRFLFILLNWMGLSSVLRPLCVAIDLFPFAGPVIGDVVALGQSIASAGVSLSICSFVIAVSWLALRPAIGVPLLLLAIGVGGGLAVAVRRQRRRRAAAARAARASYSRLEEEQGLSMQPVLASPQFGSPPQFGVGMQVPQPPQGYAQPPPQFGGPPQFGMQPQMQYGVQPQPQQGYAQPQMGMQPQMQGFAQPPGLSMYGMQPLNAPPPPPFFAAPLPPPRSAESYAMGVPAFSGAAPPSAPQFPPHDRGPA